ncbi:hypothetical protein BU26DRAFT_499478 [Trematosphaeria pertusa]|uniref:BHLH domain-containing protein n=1 Tax=Trematosphaeria pertusa TaxID=390896 RepID=A0A6A6J1Z3_9PLEO|nr:uncharacterized protein BU26DRAFT_499478 [Trematosphaeria pertusa]KAF2256865.1 hypothetical protein BU26DRAFT_499478 [Trematosphaeria pertusa]
MEYSEFTSYPVVASTDYSPTNEAFSYPEAFDKAYIADSYTTSPDHSLASFFDCDSYFDRPVSSVEGPAPGVFAPKNPAVFNATLPAATSTPAHLNSSYSSSFNSAPFGRLEQFPSGFAFDTASNAFESSVSPVTAHSRTPSLCGDGPHYQAPSSPELSPRPTLKREPTDEGVELEEDPMPKRPQRKRGRPRLDRSNTDTSSTSSKCHRTSRLPHNQVERKYREGLNAELERLRRTVPTLPQSEEGGVMGQPKPSKAMVLAGAIDYIKKIEKERDMYREENDRLRGFAQQSWNKKQQQRADSVSDFLVDP